MPFVVTNAAGANADGYSALLAFGDEGMPLGWAGQPDDIAPVTAFLASDGARWVAGETLFV
jgi:NAD(P)-dependent dehydrogenase (short-subunit alcohol dehydrogenase family)